MKTWMAVVAGVAMVAWLGATGCAGPKPTPSQSPQGARADSDRFFEKMKQEERDHGKGPEKTGSGDSSY